VSCDESHKIPGIVDNLLKPVDNPAALGASQNVRRGNGAGKKAKSSRPKLLN
jgi:hypothetical protein